MTFDQLANQLNEYFSIYSIRVLVVVVFLLIFTIWILGRKYIRERKSLPFVFGGLFLLILLFVFVVPFVFFAVNFVKEAVLGVLITVSPLILLFISYLIWMIAVSINRKKEVSSQEVAGMVGGAEQKVEKRSYRIKPLIVIFLGIASLALLVLAYVSVFSRPYIVLAGEKENTTVNETANIQFRLSVPVLKKSLRFTISPNQDVNIEYDYVGFSKDWVEGFVIHPTENYPAGSKLVIYVVGLSDIFPGGKEHEQSLDFFTPTLPSVIGTNLDAVEGDISVDTDLEFELDKKNTKSVKWSVEIEPPVEFEIVQGEDGKIGVRFVKLAQGTAYSLKLMKGNRIYNTKSGQEIRVLDEEVEREVTFKTIDPPGIKKFNWDNTSLANSEPLVIEFTDRISLEIFKDKYRIEPNIPHTLSVGDDGNSLILKPNTQFAKDTTYRVTFVQGLTTLSGSFFESDTTISFKTAGVARVIYFNPRSNGTGVSINQKSVSVTFDQRVDRTSAEERFSISPHVPGSFAWNGNTMVYNLGASLAYYTRYTINVGAGVKSIYGIDSTQAFSSSFLTEEQVVTLKVPLFYQPKGFDCNLYAVKMALAYRGVNISIESAKASIGIGENPNVNWVDGYGVHAGPLAGYIRGFRGAVVKSGFSASGLASEIMAGNPVIVYVYNGASQPYGPYQLDPGGYTAYMGMHSEVVIGFTGNVENPTSIITNDPWKGRRKLPIGTFNGLWNYMGRIAIVVQ